MSLIASLKTYSLTHFGRRNAEVRTAAHKAPVVLTHHGKPDLVMLDIDAYEALVRYQPRARRVDELRPDEIELITTQPAGTSASELPAASADSA